MVPILQIHTQIPPIRISSIGYQLCQHMRTSTTRRLPPVTKDYLLGTVTHLLVKNFLQFTEPIELKSTWLLPLTATV